MLSQETKRKIQMVEVDMGCTVCNDGHMRPTGVAYLTDPPRYPHACDNCGAKADFPVMYPCLKYYYKDTGEEIKAFR